MSDNRKYINKAKSIVISRSEDFRPYLDLYISESRARGTALNHLPYLRSTMTGIFEASIHQALGEALTDRDSRLLVRRLYRLCDNLKRTETATRLNLHTPAYAAAVIAGALSGKPLTDREINLLEPLDQSVRAYFEMAEEKLHSQLDTPEAPAD